MKRSSGRRLLVLSQVYVPDPASVGQHLHDTCAELVRRGHRVVVLTAREGYNDPRDRYPVREVRNGVEIRRIRFSSFGKRNLLFRVAGQLLFLLQCLARAAFMRGVEGVLVSTSPPMGSAAGLVLSLLHRAPLVFWVMDLNPDQAVVTGAVSATSPWVRLFDAFNRRVLRHAAVVVTLDRFMAERVLRKLDVRDKLEVMPPWPHEGHLKAVAHDRNPFRIAHGLRDRLVFMYSGNHSPFTPLRTFLDAALELRDDPRLVFVFVGGGLGKREVEDVIATHRPPNLLSLPYQPIDQIQYSLSAADVHLVSLGDREVGVRHPCKIYHAMALGRPVLFLGPRASSIGQLLDRHAFGWQVVHGDVAGAVALVRAIASMAPAERAAMGGRGRVAVEGELSQHVLCGRLCDIVERSLRN